MSYSLAYSIGLGSSNTGLASDLRAQVLDSSGVSVGSAISTGFVEVGGGWYLVPITLADGQIGAIKFYRSSTSAVLAVAAINPQEGEYVDAKVTSRLASGSVTLAADQAVNVTKVDGAALSTHVAGMFPGDLRDIAGAAVSTTTAQLGVNVAGYGSGQAPLQPTTAGRTLDVSATGEAGVDWANVGSPTTALALTGTTISTSQVAASVTGAVGSVTGNVGGNVTGSVGSVVGAVGSVTAVSDKTGYSLAVAPATPANVTTAQAAIIAAMPAAAPTVAAIRAEIDANSSQLTAILAAADTSDTDLATVLTDLNTLLARISAARALLLDNLALISAGSTTFVPGPVDDAGLITITRGDAYQNVSGSQALEWTDTTGAWVPYVGKTAAFTAKYSTSTLSATATFSVPDAGAPNTVLCRVELTSAQTAALAVTSKWQYDVQVALVVGSRDVTPLPAGSMTVRTDYTPASAP